MVVPIHVYVYMCIFNQSACCFQMLTNAKQETTTVHRTRRATTSKVVSGVSPSAALPTTKRLQTRESHSFWFPSDVFSFSLGFNLPKEYYSTACSTNTKTLCKDLNVAYVIIRPLNKVLNICGKRITLLKEDPS